MPLHVNMTSGLFYRVYNAANEMMTMMYGKQLNKYIAIGIKCIICNKIMQNTV